MQVTKSQLEELYINRELSVRKCAEVLGVPYGSMSWFMKKYGIKGRDKFITARMGVKSRRSYRGENGPGWKGGKIKCHCQRCGELMKHFPSQKRKYCSECKYGTETITRFGYDLVGVRFGRLIVKRLSSQRDNYRRRLWECICDCGNIKYVMTGDLTTSRIQSCGCYQDECRIGENNHNWNGGSSYEPYCREWVGKVGKELKADIRKRDDYRCQNPHCNKGNPHQSECKRALPVHHIDDNKKNCHPNNLITLCVSCNFRACQDRLYWQLLYSSMMDFNAHLLTGNSLKH